MRVQNFGRPSASWEAVLSWPHPHLRSGIYAYVGFRMGTGLTRAWQELPGGSVTLLLGLGSEHSLWCHRLDGGTASTSYRSYVCGLTTRSAWIIEPSESAHCIAVVMTPWAAFAIFGVAMNELAGSIIESADLLGERVNRLASALAAVPDWGQRFHLLDEVLEAWIARGDAWSPRVAWAHAELVRSVRAGGAIPIRRLAEGAGWKPRQLEYRFKEQIGVSPKVMARILRFRRAALMLADGRRSVNAAADCGFSDQAHLTREFKAMAGFTPERLREKARIAAATSPIYALSQAAARFTKTLVLPADLNRRCVIVQDTCGGSWKIVEINASSAGTSMRILLAGADGRSGESLATGLRQHGHEVELVRTGKEVLAQLDRTEFVLFDLPLPDLDGGELCRRVRAESAVPIIAFADADAQLDRVLVLRAGADDCAVRPLGLQELAARIDAVRRRTDRTFSALEDVQQKGALYRLGALTVDALRRWVTVDGSPIRLTRKEFELLALLAEARGAVVTRDLIIAKVWGDNWYGSTRTLDVHVGALRAKLGDKRWIETIRGVGFRLCSLRD